MQKPIDSVEKEFNADGIFFLEQKSINDSSFEGRYIGVDIEIAVIGDASITPPDFSLSIVNRRSVALLATDWDFIERDGQKILTFSVFQRMPQNLEQRHSVWPSEDEYVSFLDLCFFAGNEEIPEIYGDDIITRPRVSASPMDLGWTLPSRFVDPLIDALGKLDNAMLGGNIEHALIYGPVVISK